MPFFGSLSNILQADLVLHDILDNADAPREISKDNNLAKHYIKFADLLNRAKKDFMRRYSKSFTLNSDVSEYKFLVTIGVGAFGSVVLAKKSGLFFAAKIMEKSKIVQAQQVEHVHNEIRMLDALNFQFVVHLEDFIRTNCYVIMVMPLIRGGELFEYIKGRGKCEEFQAKFFASQVILAFEYMHEMGVIYRDLKPENVLIDDHGYIKLADLGFCKKVDNERTWSFCGTPEYLAPEIITNLGYNRSVDWWALGIFIYEITAGVAPFVHKDSLKLYEKIVSGVFSFPSHFSSNLQHLLTNLIEVDRTKRFGLLKAGVKDLKDHPWFKNIEWNGILDKTIHPPYKPKITSEDDTSYFPKKSFAGLKECEQNEYAEEFAEITTPTKSIKNSIKASFRRHHKSRAY